MIGWILTEAGLDPTIMNGAVMNLYRQIEIMQREVGVFKIRKGMSDDISK